MIEDTPVLKCPKKKGKPRPNWVETVWMKHVKTIRAENEGLSYRDALKKASETYVKQSVSTTVVPPSIIEPEREVADKLKQSKYEKEIKTAIPGIIVNGDKNLKPLPKQFVPNENNLKDMKKYAKILKDKVKNKKLTETEYNRIISEVNEQIKKLKTKV